MHCSSLQTVAPQGAFETTPCTSVRLNGMEVSHG